MFLLLTSLTFSHANLIRREKKNLPWNLDIFVVKQTCIQMWDPPYLTGFGCWSTQVKTGVVPKTCFLFFQSWHPEEHSTEKGSNTTCVGLFTQAFVYLEAKMLSVWAQTFLPAGRNYKNPTWIPFLIFTPLLIVTLFLF